MGAYAGFVGCQLDERTLADGAFIESPDWIIARPSLARGNPGATLDGFNAPSRTLPKRIVG